MQIISKISKSSISYAFNGYIPEKKLYQIEEKNVFVSPRVLCMQNVSSQQWLFAAVGILPHRDNKVNRSGCTLVHTFSACCIVLLV